MLQSYLAPWTRGQKGVVVTNQDFPKSKDYDVIELHDHGNTGENGDNVYPWVFGTMFEQAHESLAKTLRWLFQHVESKGTLILELPYPLHTPAQILELVQMAYPGVWVVSNELRGDSMLLILQLKRPAPDSAPTFYLDNRPEIGDTISMLPLIHQLRAQWKGCIIVARSDKHRLLPPWVSICEHRPEHVTGVLHQWTNNNEFGDYYRRTDDFYYYPIHLAQDMGWLNNSQSTQPEIPVIIGGLSSALRDKLKTFKKNNYVVVAPEANGANREWGAGRWQHVIRWLLETGTKVVVLASKKFDFSPENVCHKFANLSNMTSVSEAATIIQGAQLLIGCDSSPAHFAMGHKTRAIVLQGPTAGAPLFRYDQVRSVRRKDSDCVNCFQRVENPEPYPEGKQPHLCICSPRPHSACMLAISVTQVIDVLQEELFNVAATPPTLSICIMAKNEAKNIRPALAGAVIAADEVILVDTGSTDETVEIANSFGDKVNVCTNTTVGFDGDGVISDFSAVRNFAFKKAQSKYVMWLDAGDRIENPEKLRRDVQAELGDVLFMPTIFGSDKYRRERVGPNGMVHFSDRVHETMTIDGLTIVELEHSIRHVGTVKVGREGSLARNIRLLKQMLEENPKSKHRFRWNYYLARDLKQSGKEHEAMKYFAEVSSGDGFHEEKAHAGIEIARHYMSEKKYGTALLAAYDVLKQHDGRRAPYYVIGDAYYWLGDYEKAVHWFHHCLAIPRPQTMLWLWEDLYTWLPQCQLSYCYEKLNDKEKALHWAMEELKEAPSSQKRRIKDRIKGFGGQL